MSDLKVTYSDLEAAEAAAKKAQQAVAKALSDFSGPTTLGGNDFTNKATDVRDWYVKSRASFVTLLENSQSSFGQFESAFATTALLFQLLDQNAGNAAAGGK